MYAYNVQPGVDIDYDTGANWANGQSTLTEALDARQVNGDAGALAHDYVLNTSSRKFHAPDCPSCADISGDNRQDYHGTRDDLLARGYEPCGSCRP